jgi:hypothetical protein
MGINQIIYVLSTNYAGSHFLVLQLAAHSKCISVGELHRFNRESTRYKQACHICKTDEECPVFQGLYGQPIDRLHPLLMDNVNKSYPEVDTFVDNSKKTAWAEKFLDLPNVQQKYIHLIRDPRALVRRWMMNYDTRAEKNKVRRLIARRCWPKTWNILTGSEANVYAWKWVHQNKLITDFLTKNNLDYKLVTYHDLVFKADDILKDLMLWTGHEYEPEQKEYWKFTHHGSQKPQYMKPPETGDKRFDQRWKEYLDSDTLLEIDTHTAIAEYLASQGLSLTDAGIIPL